MSSWAATITRLRYRLLDSARLAEGESGRPVGDTATFRASCALNAVAPSTDQRIAHGEPQAFLPKGRADAVLGELQDRSKHGGIGFLVPHRYQVVVHPHLQAGAGAFPW